VLALAELEPVLQVIATTDPEGQADERDRQPGGQAEAQEQAAGAFDLVGRVGRG